MFLPLAYLSTLITRLFRHKPDIQIIVTPPPPDGLLMDVVLPPPRRNQYSHLGHQHRTRESLSVSPPVWLTDPQLLPVTERSSCTDVSLVRSVLATLDSDDGQNARANLSRLIAEDSDIFVVGSDSDTEDSDTSFSSDMSSFTDPDSDLAYLGPPDKSSFPSDLAQLFLQVDQLVTKLNIEHRHSTWSDLVSFDDSDDEAVEDDYTPWSAVVSLDSYTSIS